MDPTSYLKDILNIFMCQRWILMAKTFVLYKFVQSLTWSALVERESCLTQQGSKVFLAFSAPFDHLPSGEP